MRQKFQPQVIAAFGSAAADEYDFGRVDAVCRPQSREIEELAARGRLSPPRLRLKPPHDLKLQVRLMQEMMREGGK
jgi:hypothetical protein